jgi:RimJ/RimL family protein N-acetyltransferase
MCIGVSMPKADHQTGAADARVQIVPLIPADIEELMRITDVPDVTGTIDVLGPRFTRDRAEQVIRGGLPGADRFLGIRASETGTLVGCVITAFHGADEVEIGYWLGRDFQSNGYAWEAVCALIASLRAQFPERQIVAECRPENTPSWRLLEKVGFHDTGKLGHRSGRRKLVLTEC